MGRVEDVTGKTSEGAEEVKGVERGGMSDAGTPTRGDADMRLDDDDWGGYGGSNLGSESNSQTICINEMPLADPDSDLGLNSMSPEVSKSDMSEGRGEEVCMSAGNEIRACMEDEEDFSGTKSSSVKMWGLRGKMPVQAKVDTKRVRVMDAARTSMYSGTTL
jgi:hypothetical protein